MCFLGNKKALSVEREYLYSVSVQIRWWIARLLEKYLVFFKRIKNLT
jgi:hypothetical protein